MRIKARTPGQNGVRERAFGSLKHERLYLIAGAGGVLGVQGVGLAARLPAHRPLPAESELAQAITVLARAQQDAVWQRTGAHNQLRSLLREFYPAILDAFADKRGGLLRGAIHEDGQPPDRQPDGTAAGGAGRRVEVAQIIPVG